jgi:acyl-CoA reductase-like NAD-dependent aldehyde dehydrogenase
LLLKVNIHHYLMLLHALTAVTVHEASEQDTDNAVAAAKAAFPAWSELTPEKRGSYFKKLANLIRESNDELAALEASSMGRPIGAFIDAHASASKWDRYAEAGYSVQGKIYVDATQSVEADLQQAQLASKLRASST